MTLEHGLQLYIAAATMTGLASRAHIHTHTHIYRRALLWPAYWLYLAALFLVALKEDFARDR